MGKQRQAIIFKNTDFVTVDLIYSVLLFKINRLTCFLIGLKIRVSLVRFRLWAPFNSLKSLEFADKPSLTAALSACCGLPRCEYDSCMSKSCKTLRADTDLEQILRWWVCDAVSHRYVRCRLCSPTDFQQLQYLKMFGAYPNIFASV